MVHSTVGHENLAPPSRDDGADNREDRSRSSLWDHREGRSRAVRVAVVRRLG